MIQPDAEYRHKWRVGDIVIWDNRCSYHKAAGDYPPHVDRIHWRVSIKDFVAEEPAGGGITFRAGLVHEGARPAPFPGLAILLLTEYEDLDLDGQSHHYPQQELAMNAHRMLLWNAGRDRFPAGAQVCSGGG